MNINGNRLCYEGLGKTYLFSSESGDVTVYRLPEGIPLLDVWRFSSWKKYSASGIRPSLRYSKIPA